MVLLSAILFRYIDNIFPDSGTVGKFTKPVDPSAT